ncbi:MAG: F0F1 ATP synthase subunit B' [Parvibaculaceae bacterium]
MAQDLAAQDGMTAHTTVPQEAHSVGFPPFNAETFPSQIFWFVLIFIALYVILSRIALPRIESVLLTRQTRLTKDLEDAAAAKAQTDAAIASYEAALADARAKAHKIAQETRDKLLAETEALRHQTEAKLAAKIAEAEASIAATKATALTHVRSIAIETTGTIVNRLLGEDADKAATETAVDAAMKRS